MIQTYNTNSGTQYKVRVFLKSRANPLLRVTKQEGGIKSELEAKKIEDRLYKDCERELHQLEGQGPLFEALLNSWSIHFEKIRVMTGKRSETTHGDYLGGVRKWFSDYMRGPAADLNSYQVAEVFEKMKLAGLSHGHRKKMKQVLKSIFDHGIQTGLLQIQRSPTMDVVLSKEKESKPEILTLKEINALLRLSHDQKHEWRHIWAAALLTGMRSGELYALEWKDIDWENSMVNVNKSYNCRLKSIGPTKGGYWRQVPISAELQKTLRELQVTTGQNPHVFPRTWQWEKGLQAKVLRSFCFINGIPSIKFHTLRACFATQLLRQGVVAAKVMKVCGWKELKTMQHYVRLAGIEIQGVTDGLQIFSPATEMCA